MEKMGIGWAARWNTFKRIAAGASAEEKLALFSGTARRVYRLSCQSPTRQSVSDHLCRSI
jgi:hypothetical protein